jgi:hypothetical protein
MKAMSILKYIMLLLAVLSCAQFDPPGETALKNEPQLGEITIKENTQMGPSRAQRPNYVPGQVLVKFNDGVDAQVVETIQRALSLKTIRIVRRPNFFLMRIMDESSVEAVIQRLRGFPEVADAEPNYRVTVR